VRRFSVVTSALRARSVLYWPTQADCVWLECWLPKSQRGTGHVHEFVSWALDAISGTHHFHFFDWIASFNEIAARHRFEPMGRSRWFENCVAHRYTSIGGSGDGPIRVRTSSGALPALRVATSLSQATRILRTIDRDFKSR
jgi:hypothetical protein